MVCGDMARVRSGSFGTGTLGCSLPMQAAPGHASSGFRVGKLIIEFDETSQLQRVRFGHSATDAVFSVLAAWSI